MAKKFDIFIIVYLNNILIYIKDKDKAISRLYSGSLSSYKVFSLCQLEEIMLLLERYEILWLYSIFAKCLHKKQENLSYKRLA